MERLTKYHNGVCVYIGPDCKYPDTGEIAAEIDYKNVRAILKRLAAYEDAEQDGRLLMLPCKVGETVYVINGDRISMAEVTIIRPFVFANRIEFRGNAVLEEVDPFYNDGRLSKRNLFIVFGDDAFLTREEAEAALKGGAE